MEALYVPDNAAQVALRAAMRNGDTVILVREEDGVYIESATAIVSGLDDDAPDQAEATISAEFVIDGAWVSGT
jgi:hypothetical protein